MAARDLDSFMETPDEFDQLSAEDQAALFAGRSIEGETTSDAPDADDNADERDDPAADAATRDDEPETQPAPVVIAKDGKHTIPFEELEAAREQAKFWKQKAELAAQANASQVAEPRQQDEPVEVDLDELEMLADDAHESGDTETRNELRKQIRAEVERRTAARVLSEIAERNAAAKQADDQAALQAEAARIFASQPYLNHEGEAPNHKAIAQVRALRDLNMANGMSPADALADAAAEIGRLYSPENAAAKADEAIKSAKARTPTSMSSIPMAATPYHDEAEAMVNMSASDLGSKFAKMTSAQIEEALARTL